MIKCKESVVLVNESLCTSLLIKRLPYSVFQQIMMNVTNETFCAIWYHLHKLKNMKNTDGGMFLLAKWQSSACRFTKSNTTYECSSRFLNWANGAKLRKGSQMNSNITTEY